MADEDEYSPAAKSATGHAAEAIALGAPGPLDPRAAAYLEEQSRLARLQSQNLIEQNAFELSHLRWRRFNDQMKGALQIMLVVVGAAIVFALGAAVWNASRADGIVVESISVPPQFVQNGITGDVIADDVTYKIAAIRDIANGNSLDASKDVRKERDNDIKVEIPETGISISQAWRYLRAWLGHERHLSGNLRMAGDGRLRIAVALDGENVLTAEGTQKELDKLEQQAAEHVFANVDPINYVLYLSETGRNDEALTAVRHATQVLTNPADRADAYSLWSFQTRFITANLSIAALRARMAIDIEPKLLAPHRELMWDSFDPGHDEEALWRARAIASFNRADQPPDQQGRAFDWLVSEGAYVTDLETGDFAHLLHSQCDYYCGLPSKAEMQARLHAPSLGWSLFTEAVATGGEDPDDLAKARYFLDASVNKWPEAVSDANSYIAALRDKAAKGRLINRLLVKALVEPLRADALAQTGDFAAAHRTIDDTPVDCVHCETARGHIDELQKNFGGAAYWFARAIHDAPSIPFAYSDWGRMLLANGDIDGAIAKLTLASEKGPHFADPLEMWGEALIRENRSDLALAKFSEAAKYAPNWGRLHLKWGEALRWSGDKMGAAKQFDLAASLDLTTPEKSELVRVRGGYG